jgi:hypothetical protein
VLEGTGKYSGQDGNNGNNSSISGTGITTITSTGGGGVVDNLVLEQEQLEKLEVQEEELVLDLQHRSGGSGTANQGFAGGDGFRQHCLMVVEVEVLVQ